MTRHVHSSQQFETPFGTMRADCVLPTPEGETLDHQLNGFCWCQPLVEDVLPDGHLYIHRRSLDSPHIERVP